MIEANVTIGKGCKLGHHVVIREGTVVGDTVRIDDHASLGKHPMKAANSATTKEQELPPLTVGELCIVGTGVVLYRGAAIDAKVLMADLATIRENVTIGRGTIVGRGVTVENFCSVGRYCKLESECYVTAYSTLEDRVFVAPGVVTSNDNFVGRTQERFKHFKGVTVKNDTAIPFTIPIRMATAATRTNASAMLLPCSYENLLTSSAETVIVPGRDRSIPRCMTTSVWPIAAMARIPAKGNMASRDSLATDRGASSHDARKSRTVAYQTNEEGNQRAIPDVS